uniref:UBC core domain-containing protein n=1 Tax=Rhizochromulina marina TaxID=1034831 RepID=A0A7S2W505_9STRA|mmetsp:Transcript_14251/g.42030  ORF Transcript_14251/g.42030 Transcript_14251/m.42030 type:complete len:388 (+) Transcript_14251:79-1242(+)
MATQQHRGNSLQRKSDFVETETGPRIDPVFVESGNDRRSTTLNSQSQSSSSSASGSSSSCSGSTSFWAGSTTSSSSSSSSSTSSLSSASASGGSAVSLSAADQESQYCRQLGALQYEERPDLPTFCRGLLGSSESNSAGGTRQRLRRLVQEHADLSQSLPCTASSSVWLRAREDRMDQVQFLISGPEGTPYSGGLFLFSAFIPIDYPNVSPKVKFQTTGGGQVRFNPNLYCDGKVCLSLLGTWRGKAGENWNPLTSSLLQVIISIQSLILVPDPYFNEPGFEAKMMTDEGRLCSSTYNAAIRAENVHFGMISHLLEPPIGFEEVVQRHFRYRKDFILRQCRAWASEESVAGRDAAAQHSAGSMGLSRLPTGGVTALLPQLEEALGKL